MIKNYFKSAWRALLKNRTASAINISGLAVGLGIGIIAIIWITHQFSYDKFHKNYANIYLLMTKSKTNGEIGVGKESPAPLTKQVLNELPEIKTTARTSQPNQQLLRVGEKNIYELGMYAEPTFFDMMTFKTLAGDPRVALNQSGSVVITERTAKKLFGDENPIGKLIDHNNSQVLKVEAVIADVPENSTNQFDVVFPFKDFERANSNWIERWDYYIITTWVQTIPQTDHILLDKRINGLFHKKQKETGSLFTYPLADLRLYNEFKNGEPSGGRIYAVVLLGIIGLFVLLIACINFMNLTTAQSQRRAKEVGVRKVVGATRWQTIFQFLTEAFLLTLVATVLGISVAKIGLPLLNEATTSNIPFDLLKGNIWLIFIPLIIFTALIAGSYPAFFLSKFKPTDTLKGISAGKNNKFSLRKVLVTFQFIVSIFLIITSIVIFKQLEFSKSRPIGYKPDNLIQVVAHGEMAEKFTVMKSALLQISGVSNVTAGNDNLLQFGGSVTGLGWTGKTPDQDFSITMTSIQFDWINTIGAKMVEGRDFNESYGSDTASCLINEAAVRKMGLKAPVIGKMVGDKEVIGVVGDFIYNNPNSSTAPMIINYGANPMSNFFVRISEHADRKKILQEIEQLVKRQNPNYPFEYRFISEEYQRKFDNMYTAGKMINTISVLAIIISCLGLYGLSAYVAEIKAKEIGIRKVLGANIKQIWSSLSKDFLLPVGLAFLIVTPIAVFAMDLVLSNWEYHVNLSWWIFALAGLIALTIAVLTVSYHAIKAALVNPVESIKTE